MSVLPFDAVSSVTAIAGPDAVTGSRLVVAERLSLLKQQQVRLQAQRETTTADKAMDREARATMLMQLAVQQSRIDEQIVQLETQIAEGAAASDAADAAAATTTAPSAADTAAVTTTAAPQDSHIHVVA
jgi:septal ring factor EnvC (AmiA/AmiB activator)